MFPEGEKRASIIPPTPPCGFFTPSTDTCRYERPHDLQLLLPSSSKSSSITCTARGSASAWIRRRSAAPGAGGIPAHLDGRQGGRLGGDAAAGQSGGDQRALVQRAALMAEWLKEEGQRRPCTDSETADVCGIFQPAVLVRTGGISTTWWMGKAAMIPPAVRTRYWRSRSITRSSTRRVATSNGRGEDACSHPSGCVRSRPAIRITSRNITATCDRAMRHIIRARSGHG